MWRTRWLAAAVAMVALAPLAAQDVQVLAATFSKNFERGENYATRLEVVRDAVASKVTGMGAFYHRVLDYVLSRASEVGSQGALAEMAVSAAQKIAEEKYREARGTAWALFKATDEGRVRVALLESLAATAAGDGPLISEIADFLEGLNTQFRAGVRPDLRQVMGLVRVLSTAGDPRGFRALFATRVSRFSEEITAAADAALLDLQGDLRELFGAVIRGGSPAERLDAFRLAVASTRIDQRGKAALAEEAMRAGLDLSAPAQAERVIGRELRAAALAVLAEARWAQATSLVIEHFGTAAMEYDRGQVTVDYLASAATGLAAMGTHEAAERLTLYLEFLNSYREHNKPYDEQIVLAVIAGLKRLGDKVAFANLSYAQYLGYSERVKQAARDAIGSLKW